MKTAIKTLVLIFGILILNLLGGVPFLLALLIGVLINRPRLAYPIGLLSILVLTLYSGAYPETFRFGESDLKIHDNLRIHGINPLIVNTVENLIFVILGVRIGSAFRLGLDQTKQHRTRCHT